MNPIFHLHHVRKQFGDLAALQDVSLRIMPGERVALVGPSGSGKSTLINLLNGTLLPDGGTVKVLGRDLAGLRPGQLRRLQSQIGTIYQQFHLVGSLRVVHNVNAGHLGRWSLLKAAFSLVRPLAVEQAARTLARVGIPEKLYERTDRLSGGQQQRVALARVLVQDPVAILADEPIASLDPERSRQIMDLLRDLAQEMDKTLLFSSHTVEYAFSHGRRIIGLRGGRVLFDAPPAEVSQEMVARLYALEGKGNRVELAKGRGPANG